MKLNGTEMLKHTIQPPPSRSAMECSAARRFSFNAPPCADPLEPQRGSITQPKVGEGSGALPWVNRKNRIMNSEGVPSVPDCRAVGQVSKAEEANADNRNQPTRAQEQNFRPSPHGVSVAGQWAAFKGQALTLPVGAPVFNRPFAARIETGRLETGSPLLNPPTISS
jgi:hypothetical protein